MFQIVAVLLSFSFVNTNGKPIKPLTEWQGNFPNKADEFLRKEAPKTGYISDEKSWEKLWKAWRGQEKVPELDFKKQLVIVGTTEGARNKISPHFTVNDEGDLKGGFDKKGTGHPGFAYRIIVIDRSHIKTYKGKAISK